MITSWVRPISLAAVVAVGTVLSGCSDDPVIATDSTPQPVATVGQASELEPADEIRTYMEAIARSDPEEMRDAMDLAAENSAAHTYMFFQVTRAEALLDGGFSMSDLENDVSRVDEGYELCQPGGDCTTFDGFEVADGLLTDLQVDGDSPGPRLSLGNGDTVESNGVAAEMLVVAATSRSRPGLVK